MYADLSTKVSVLGFLLFTAGGRSHTTGADGARLQWASFTPSLCHLVIWIDRNI